MANSYNQNQPWSQPPNSFPNHGQQQPSLQLEQFDFNAGSDRQQQPLFHNAAYDTVHYPQSNFPNNFTSTPNGVDHVSGQHLNHSSQNASYGNSTQNGSNRPIDPSPFANQGSYGAQLQNLSTFNRATAFHNPPVVPAPVPQQSYHNTNTSFNFQNLNAPTPTTSTSYSPNGSSGGITPPYISTSPLPMPRFPIDPSPQYFPTSSQASSRLSPTTKRQRASDPQDDTKEEEQDSGEMQTEQKEGKTGSKGTGQEY